MRQKAGEEPGNEATQTMDTELLSQRLAEYQYCLPEHMHGHAAYAPS